MTYPEFTSEYKESIKEQFLKDFATGLTNRQLGEKYFEGNLYQAKRLVDKYRNQGLIKRGERQLEESPDTIEYFERASDETKDKAGIFGLYKQSSNSVRKLAEEQDRTQVFTNLAREIIQPLKPYPVPRINIGNNVNEYRIPNLIISDAHVGQKITKAESGGLEEFNLDVFNKRIENLIEVCHKKIEQLRYFYDIDTLKINFLGDNTDGETIYQGQAQYIEMPRIDQVECARQGFAKILQWAAQVFPKVDIYCVGGNHARPSLKGFKHHRTSWDTVLYRFLEADFKDQKNLNFNISQSTELIYTIEEAPDFNFMSLHGEYVSKKSLKSIVDQYSSMFRIPIDYVYLGHFHSYQSEDVNHGAVIVNGSFPGGNLFSKNICRTASTPKQTLLIINPDCGIEERLEIYLDNKRNTRLSKNKNGIYSPV